MFGINTIVNKRAILTDDQAVEARQSVISLSKMASD